MALTLKAGAQGGYLRIMWSDLVDILTYPSSVCHRYLQVWKTSNQKTSEQTEGHQLKSLDLLFNFCNLCKLH